MNIKEAPKLAIKNKDRLRKDGECSCYSCMNVFKVEEIKEWTDNHQTALCPHCGTDSVLPDRQPGQLLTDINKYWFQK